MKKSLSGKRISKKEALRGLGDPRKWAADSEKVYAEFRAKPKAK